VTSAAAAAAAAVTPTPRMIPRRPQSLIITVGCLLQHEASVCEHDEAVGDTVL
jgi:hypothetical protein